MTDNMTNNMEEIEDLHRFLSIIQNLNVGVIVVNRAFKVKIWNSFMDAPRTIIETTNKMDITNK